MTPRTIGPTIYPTFSCFDDCIEYIEHRVKTDPTLAFRNDFLLVHAIIDPIDSEVGPHAHSWVEEGAHAIFCGLLYGEKAYCTVDKAEYLDACRPLDVTRYTMRQVLEENRKSGHYGPWKETYMKFCRNGGE